MIHLNLYNNKITHRTNKLIREKIRVKAIRKKLKNQYFTILCNNCTGGFILHDLGCRFNTPTINMFFHDLDFFDFIEHFDYYIKQPTIQIDNPHYDPYAPDYPVAVLKGDGNLKDLELHFLHYKTFEEANNKWEIRKARINFEKTYVIWTFMGMEENEELYLRAQNLPCKNKVIFVNHPVDNHKYPDFYYIKGFEDQVGLGQISKFQNLLGKRYYDQFDFVKWINKC